MLSQARIRSALQAGFFHFCASLCLALVVALLVFQLWFPYPYREMSGGRELFWLVMGVDVVCGPLLTLVLSNPLKSRRERYLDWSLVIGLQIGALAYGLITLAQARPVALVFEVDRFRAVTVSDIAPEDLALAPLEHQTLSLTGPQLKGLRPANNSDEQLNAIALGVQGIEPSMRPQWWQDYSLSVTQVLAKSKPIEQLRRKHPTQSAPIDEALQSGGLSGTTAVWLPLVGRKSSEWVVLLDPVSAQPKAYLPLDGF
jgi:hypothetical protein